MKIAAAQSIVTNDVAENSRTICALIRQAALQGARLVNFCEGDRDNPDYDIPLKKARPWRQTARQGEIYTDKQVDAE